MRDLAGTREWMDRVDGKGEGRRATAADDSSPAAAVVEQAFRLSNQQPEDGTSRAAATGARHYRLAPIDRDSVR